LENPASLQAWDVITNLMILNEASIGSPSRQASPTADDNLNSRQQFT